MNWKKIGVVIFILLCSFFVYRERHLLFQMPFSQVEFENVVYATKDDASENGNIFVLDASGSRLRKIDAEHQLQWEVESSENGFQEADRVVVNPNGRIFVQDLVKEEGSFRISGERILEYSQEGKFIHEIAEFTYEESILSPSIAGLFPTKDGVVFVKKERDGFQLLNQDLEVQKEGFLEFGEYIPSFAWNSKTNEMYYCTYGGKVCKYIDGKNDQVLYDVADTEEFSVPEDISVDEEGNLYIADIGSREIFIISTDGSIQKIAEEGELSEREIMYTVNSDYGIVSCTDYFVKDYQGDSYVEIASCKMTVFQSLLCILMWLCVFLLSIVLLITVFFCLKYLIKSTSKFTKMATGLVFGVIIVASIFSGILIPQFQKQILDGIVSRAQMASDIMIEHLPYEAFRGIDSPEDFMGEDYQKVREAAHSVFEIDTAHKNDLYCAFYKIQDEMIIATYCLQEDTGAIHPHDWSYQDSDEQEIIETRQGKVYSDYQTSEGSFLFVLNPIIDDTGEVIGLLEVGTDLNSFREENRKTIFDFMINIMAITVVIILIAIEFMIFFQTKSEFDRKSRSLLDGVLPIPSNLLRIIVFAIFFLTNVTTSFLPIYAMELVEKGNITFLPAEVMAAVPISAEVLMGAIASIFGNKVLEKLGTKRSVIVSSFLFTFGLGLRIIPNIWFLTLGNAIMGAGWGIVLLVVNTMIAMKPEGEKDEGFAAYNAAALNGINCGVVFGGFFVKWISHQWIFVLVTILSLSVYVVVRNYLTRYEAVEEESDDGVQQMSLLKFLLSRRILVCLLTIVVPMIACGYFMTYMFPILGSEYGLSETYIGYAYLLNGLCVICFGKVLTNFFSGKNRKIPALVAASVLYGIAFLMIAWYQNLLSLLIAILLLGLSDSFGLPLQTGYYTDLKEVKQYGYDRSIGIYSLFENVSQSAGSFVFSYVLLIGVKEGLFLVTGMIIVLVGIFFLTNFRDFGKK